VRIEELYLDGFGHFHQRTIGPVSGPVTVFYGPNEAGKSTTLAFIRAILFGFPARFNSHYPPLAGGRHGGRITVSDNSGTVYGVERYAGARGGLNIATSNGLVSNVEALLQRLTGNATPDLFRNVFAFSLDELQAAASLNDSSGAIYSAGQGAPGLPALRKSLSDHKSQIYLSRGNIQEVPKLLNTLRDVDAQLHTIEGNAGRYGALTARKSEIDLELEEADAGLERLGAQRAEIQNLLKGWDDWVALSDCETQLRDMPLYVDFPENPIARLDTLDERVREARENRDEAAGQLRRAEEAAASDIPGEDLLDDAVSIEAVRRARSSFDNSVRDLPERQGELRGLEADFARNLTDLGHQWGEEELQAFDTSLVVRNQVDGWKERITGTGERAQQAQFQLVQAQRTLQGQQEETQEAEQKLPPEPPPLDAAAMMKWQDALRTTRGRLEGYERERQNYDNLRGQLNALAAGRETLSGMTVRPNIALLALMGLAGVALVVAGSLVGGGAMILGIVGGLVLLTAAIVLWFVGRPTSTPAPSPVAAALERQTAEAGIATETARQSLLDSAAALGLDRQPDAASLDSAEARLNAARNAVDAWNSANTRVEDASRREKLQGQRVEVAVREHEAAEAEAQEAQQEWRQWLQERGLDETLTTDTMTTFLARVDTTHSSLSEARRMRDRVAAIEYDIHEFREQVERLASRHGLPLDSDDQRQLARVADELIQRLDEVQTAVSQREQSRTQAEEVRQLLESRGRRLHSVEEDLDDLLKTGNADDAEDFRRRARQNEERLELERRRDEHRRNLEWLSGPGERFDAFREVFATADPNHLGDESARLSELHAEVDVRRNALREERGGIDTELAQLTSEEESSALRVRRSTLEEQLRERAREWSRFTIAEALLEKTRQKFEQERQPSVIRHAQDFFSGVTGQRYQRLYAPIGEQTITVTDATGAGKRPEELSRGTREQLYLALRFGLIREFGEHAERLPVVVDEALVNFDPERARWAAQSFAKLAETNQVLVFTCHPTTADMFADAAGAQVVDISGTAS
jgi:uncharacterized protein YhaN